MFFQLDFEAGTPVVKMTAENQDDCLYLQPFVNQAAVGDAPMVDLDDSVDFNAENLFAQLKVRDYAHGEGHDDSNAKTEDNPSGDGSEAGSAEDGSPAG